MFNGWGWVFPVAGVVLAGFVFGDILANAALRLHRAGRAAHQARSGLGHTATIPFRGSAAR
jgi:hypothetical protein